MSVRAYTKKEQLEESLLNGLSWQYTAGKTSTGPGPTDNAMPTRFPEHRFASIPLHRSLSESAGLPPLPVTPVSQPGSSLIQRQEKEDSSSTSTTATASSETREKEQPPERVSQQVFQWLERQGDQFASQPKNAIVMGVVGASFVGIMTGLHKTFAFRAPEIKLRPGLSVKLFFSGLPERPKEAGLIFTFTPAAKKAPSLSTESEISGPVQSQTVPQNETGSSLSFQEYWTLHIYDDTFRTPFTSSLISSSSPVHDQNVQDFQLKMPEIQTRHVQSGSSLSLHLKDQQAIKEDQ